MRGRSSTHRNNDFPLGASTFEVGESLGNVRKRICFVDDDLQFSLFDKSGKLGELATAWMHEKISIADPRASGSQSDSVTDDPEHGGQRAAAAEVLDRRLRLPNGGYWNDPCSPL